LQASDDFEQNSRLHSANIANQNPD
jgi:hypothetical protein